MDIILRIKHISNQEFCDIKHKIIQEGFNVYPSMIDAISDGGYSHIIFDEKANVILRGCSHESSCTIAPDIDTFIDLVNKKLNRTGFPMSPQHTIFINELIK